MKLKLTEIADLVFGIIIGACLTLLLTLIFMNNYVDAKVAINYSKARSAGVPVFMSKNGELLLWNPSAKITTRIGHKELDLIAFQVK